MLGLGPGWPGLRPGLASGLAWPQAWFGPERGLMDKQTNKWTDGRKISPFCKTSSPIGAAAPKKLLKSQELLEKVQGKEADEYLMPWGDWLIR